MLRMLMLAICLSVAVGIASLATARAQQGQETARCQSKEMDPASMDLRIAGCTAVIDSKKGNIGDAYFRRGHTLSEKGDYDRAIADFDEAIRFNPKSSPAFNNRGVAHSKKGDIDAAIADYSQAILLDRENTLALANRASLLSSRGEYDRAIADYTAALRVEPKSIRALQGRANVYSHKFDYDHSIADLDQAIGIQPTNASLYVDRGTRYLDKGDYDRAITDLDHGIKLDPKNKVAYLNRGNTYTRKADYLRGIADYDEALRLDSGFKLAYLNRGYADFYAGHFSEAANDLERGILDNLPPATHAYRMLWVYLARERAGEQTANAPLSANLAGLSPGTMIYNIIGMFIGTVTPDNALAAASKPSERCTVHFFVGQQYLIQNKQADAFKAFRFLDHNDCPKYVEYYGARAELQRISH